MVKPPHSALQHPKSKVLGENLIKTELTETQEASSSILSSRLETIMPQLYDVESSYSEPENPLPIDLGLDQIEDYQE